MKKQNPLLCSICVQPINLETDRCTDENGDSVHEACYLMIVTSKKGMASASAVQSKFDCFA